MRILLAATTVCIAAAAHAADAPMGDKPSYLESTTEGVPNQAAMGRRIWVPGLDDGFVPQGLTIDGPYVFVSSYRSATPKVDTGPCRVFRIERATGKAAGAFDIPTHQCTHAGGLAHLGNGMLMVADTRRVLRIDVEKALAAGNAEGAIRGVVGLRGQLRGSFAAFDGKDAWIGTWTKDFTKTTMFRLDAKIFEDSDGKTVDESRATETLPIPLEAQGAAFDARGNPWISSSSGKFGTLHKLDRKGQVLEKWEMVAGLEDLAFDPDGKLWGLSESGTRKYLDWSTKFPFLFELDTAKLK